MRHPILENPNTALNCPSPAVGDASDSYRGYRGSPRQGSTGSEAEGVSGVVLVRAPVGWVLRQWMLMTNMLANNGHL